MASKHMETLHKKIQAEIEALNKENSGRFWTFTEVFVRCAYFNAMLMKYWPNTVEACAELSGFFLDFSRGGSMEVMSEEEPKWKM